MSINSEFKSPPKNYSPAPLWFWYGKLEKEKISWQIDEMVDKGVYNAFLHPRAYLLTRYLEEEWWDIIGPTLEHSRKVGFNPWLYDEYAWPSGTAGSIFKNSSQIPSRVLAKGEVNMAKGLRYRALDVNGPSKIQGVFEDEDAKPISLICMQLDENGKVIEESLYNILDKLNGEINIEQGKYRIMAFYRFVMPGNVDYLNKETIKYFIECTHEEYKKRYGEDFGSLIPGIFFDEIYNVAKPIVWSDDFEKEFLYRKGYDIKSFLPFLIYESGDKTTKVRLDYYDVLTQLYEEAFFKQISEWCEQNGLLLTGHTEEWLPEHPLQQGDYFRTMKHLHIPGADCHDYRYKYPRKISPQEPKGAVSVSRLYGRERCMSESMGGGGWATTLQEFKRGINVSAAMGINFFVLHGFYYENEHQGSQGDWPTSFFFQNPYWKYFKIFSDYISRLCLIGSKGKPVCEIGLFYPIKSVYKDFENGCSVDKAQSLGENYNKILEKLLYNQIDVDIIDEDSIVKSTIVDGKLNMGQEEISLLILPNNINIGEKCKTKLMEFVTLGGKLIFYAYDDKNEGLKNFVDSKIIFDIDSELIKSVQGLLNIDFRILEGDRDEIYYNHRIIENKDFYLVANGADKKKEIKIRFRGLGCPKIYNIETGKSCLLEHYEVVDEVHTDVYISLNEDEAVYVSFDKHENNKKLTGTFNEENIEVLNLDGVWNMIPSPAIYDNQWGVYEKETEMEIPIADFTSEVQEKWQTIRIRNIVNEPGNCGRHLSLWKANWITRRPHWGDDSSASVLYFRKKINLTSDVKSACVCIASVDRFELTINGLVVATGGGWKIPKEIDVTKFWHIGENIIAIKVENDDSLQGVNVLEAEVLPAHCLTSLIIQGEIQFENGKFEILSDDSWISSSSLCEKWDRCESNFEDEAVRVDVKNISKPWGYNDHVKWIYAWERGTPPILPWGQIPLFGRNVVFPTNIEYRIQIPAGTVKVSYPEIKGSHSIILDDSTINMEQWINGKLKINDKDKMHEMIIKVNAENFASGLLSPVKITMGNRACYLHDWCEDGLQWFSGRMIYSKDFIMKELEPNAHYILNMNDVNFHAEIWLNGKLIETRIWKPYKVDISSFLVNGNNKLSIVVSNLAANRIRYNLVDEGKALAWNRYWNEENILRDSQNLVSGLIGPVKIEIKKRTY